jgi:hypothetical protein
MEQRLLQLIREGAHGARTLDDVMAGIYGLVSELRGTFNRLQELLDRRDLMFEDASALGTLRKRALWLYQRARAEHIFFSKLRLERRLRDELYAQVMETFQELLTLENAERLLRSLPDEDLARELSEADSWTP